MRKLGFTGALTAAAFLIWSAVASAAPVFTFTGGATTTSFPDRTFGYDFTTGVAGLLVTSLGFWDEGDDGLSQSHQVGIWSADGSSLIASAVVGAGTSAFLDSGFRFVAIAPVLLAANTQYLAGAFNGDNSDAIIRFTTATASSGVTLGSTRFDPFCGVFCAPTGTQGTGFDDGYFGPNMNGQTAVPEPTSVALLGLGLAAAGYRRWARAGRLTGRRAAAR